MSTRAFIVAYFVVLFLAHQDSWWRDDPRLVLGVLPISLAYHVVWTLLVAAGWWFVAKFCWPDRLDEEAEPPAPGVAATKKDPAPTK